MVAGEGRPWPFQGGAPKPRQDVKVPCCNPRCPGVSGRQSFKFANTVGKGQHGLHCLACNMAWERSWNVHFNGHSPPSGGPRKGRRSWHDEEDEDEDEWEDDAPGQPSPAFEALSALYQGILKEIIALPNEDERQDAMDHYRNHGNPAIGKAMLAAYTETMATRQAAERPALRHPAGDTAGDIGALRKEKNKADQLERQAAAQLQRASLEMLAIQERIARDQKELLLVQKKHAEATALKEERSKDAALKDQQLQAAMAHRERELLQGAGAPTVPLVPEANFGTGPTEEQARLLQAVALAVAQLGKQGGDYKPVMEALAKIINPGQGGIGPQEASAPPLLGSLPPQPMSELNEVSMAEGKRKPADSIEVEDAEEMAATSLLGEDASGTQRGRSRSRKAKLAKQETSATLAQTQGDVDDIMRLVNKNLRRPEDAASSSTGQLQG